MANKGTYADEAPDASVGERVINSIKKVVGLPANPTEAEPKNPSSGGETTQENADRQAGGDESVASNAGSQAQSTDSYNKY